MEDNQISFNAGAQYFIGLQHLENQLSPLDDLPPKVRKPYTITKQREKWTDEEHNRFLEGLKKYGRAWRLIEEYVGNKTAVQIRSHAQKFFSKIIRDGSGSNASSIEPIEIPPPRPKQKPTHPYPRKNPPKRGADPGQHAKFSPLNWLPSEQENESPTSVLSAVGSDALGSADSNSLVSLGACVSPKTMLSLKPRSSPEENGLSPLVHEAAVQENQILEFILKDDFSKDEPTRRVKLFGATLLVSGSDISSSLGEDKEKDVQTSSLCRMSEKALTENAEYAGSGMACGNSEALYYIPYPYGDPNPKEPDCSAILQFPAFYGGNPFSFAPFNNPKSMKRQGYGSLCDKQGKDKSIVGSLCGKGFAPYKRRLVERDTRDTVFDDEYRD